MKRFVLQCSHGDYLTPTIVHIEDVRNDSDPFLEATAEIAIHVAEEHGIGPESTWSFTVVEVRGGAGDLWATEVRGEQP